MFRRVSFSENVLVSSSDSELEPTESIDDRRRTHHVGLKTDESSGGRYNTSSGLPQFQKRPLSDTPVVSRFQSPSSSAETSAESSAETSPTSSRSGSSVGSPILEPLSEDRDFLEKGGLPGTDTWPDQAMLDHMASSHTSIPKRRPTTIDVPGLTKSKTSPDGIISQKDPGSKLIIIMVGLPATGKSFITNKLSRYLNYSMYYCKVFNVGNTRRQFAKEHNMKEQDSKFFDPNDEHSKMLREKWAMDTLDQLLDYLLKGPGSVGIFDATNSTRERRKKILQKIHEKNKFIKVLYLESICSDKETVEKNIRLKLLGPDYKGKDPDSSLIDFKERLSNYMKSYQTIEDDENVPYIKMIDIGKKIVSYDIQGFLASQTVYYLLNFNLAERQIWISRSGESEFNVQGRIGGDSLLTQRGWKYAKALARFMEEQKKLFNERQMKEHLKVCSDEGSKRDFTPTEFFVWTSMKKRAMATSSTFNDAHFDIKQMKMLDELSAGDFEGMTYEEILRNHPAEYEERLEDKLRYRYPGIGGESYMDVINRLRPVITEIERITDSLLLITHRVVARVLLGYFLNLSKDVISNLDVPLHSVYCLEPKPYGVSWYLYEYDEEKDTFFKVPQSELNTMKVKEVGLVHQERRYSIIPTAPSTGGKSRSGSHSSNNTSSSSTAASSARMPAFNPPFSASAHMNAASRFIHPGRQHPAYQTHPSLLARTMSRNHSSDHVGIIKKSVSPRELSNSIELDKLNEKLSKLASSDESKNGESDDTPTGVPLTRSQSESHSPKAS